MKPLNREQARTALWRAGMLEWKLWPQQVVIYNTIRALPITTQSAVLLCARQFGKSVLGVLLALEDSLRNPDVVVMIIGPSLKQTRSIVRPRVKMLTKDAPAGLVREVKSEDTWYFANGSELKLGGFDTMGSVTSRGKTLHKVYLEEIGVDANPDTYQDFIRSDLAPALTHSKHAQIIYLTTPPKIPDHPFLLQTVPEAQITNSFFKFTIDDNSKLSKAQYDACVKMCGGRHTVEFKREYMCETVRDSSIILAPEFDEHIHVTECAKPPHCRVWLAGDVGGVRDKSVFHIMCYDFNRAKVMVLDECAFDKETGTVEIVREIKRMEAGHAITARWVDAPGQLQIDLMAMGLACTLPRKDELEATVNQVRTALTTQKVEIDPKCVLLITTLRSGTFNNQRTDLARTSTLGHMDAFMSLAYGLRHANKANPMPQFGGADPSTHHMPKTSPQTKHALASLFRS